MFLRLFCFQGQNGRTIGKEAKPLPAHVEKVKKSANVEFEAGNYNAAVCLYNQAIVLNKTAHPILHGNRAAALMKRAWDGDTYAALRDCLLAMGLDPGHVKAHLRLAQCLMDLEWLAEADQCLENFKLRHPEFIKSKAFSHLLRDLNVAKDKIKPGKGKAKLRTLPSASSPVLSQYSAADFLRTLISSERAMMGKMILTWTQVTMKILILATAEMVTSVLICLKLKLSCGCQHEIIQQDILEPVTQQRT